MKRLIEYIQKAFMRLFRCNTQTSLWIQQARCLSQSWMPVSLSNRVKSFGSLRRYDISRACFQGTMGEPHSRLTSTSGSLVVRTASVESQEAFEKTKHSAALFHNPNQDVKTAMHGDNFQCLRRVSISDPTDAVNDMEEHLDSKIQTRTIL